MALATAEEGAWGELLGEEDLVVWAEDKLTPVPVQEVLANKQFVGLYFSAHWCPPCRGFTPLLVDTYNELLQQQQQQQQQAAGQGGFQVIFVSSDRDAGAMGAYMRDAAMPWPALPFGDPRVAALKARFQVSSIPTLVILNGEGKLVTRDGRAAVLKSGPGAFGKWVAGIGFDSDHAGGAGLPFPFLVSAVLSLVVVAALIFSSL